MDWEKQDNELRKLMDGSDFLPEGELWDAGETWKKMQRNNQPLKANRRIIWLRLATAACVVGLLGIGLVWFQRGNHVTKPLIELVTKVEENGSKAGIQAKVMDSIKNQVENPSPSGAIIPLPENRNTNTANAVREKNEKHSILPGNNKVDEELSKEAVAFTNIEGSANAIVINEVAENTGKGTLPEVTATEAEIKTLALAPVKVKKIMVIHYNELKGNRTAPPPGFALIKKSPFEWESIAMQAPSTPNEPSFQLKIELSPAPKKSL
jgi:hypothetical protein